ncbi:sorting nexin-14-like isoform X2 [Anneissia japonica]|uniref:sorting nexin-14-like isoform X2 n=1 Tax=Anneissia japonica TaxID=1529436 RepID=UPI0014255082|nr:sorting nexin-14-like isoform X2 [Anneissia japonica]
MNPNARFILELSKQHSSFTAASVSLLVLSIILYSYLHILLVAWAFLAGVGSFYIIFNYVSVVPNIIVAFERKKKVPRGNQSKKTPRHVCTVCSDNECCRHRYFVDISSTQPWTDVYIPERVDKALSELFELILKDFVYSWYKDVSQDEEFVNELRSGIRFMAAVLLKRIQEVDLPTLILDKLVKNGLSHLDLVLRTKRKLKPTDEFDVEILKAYGPHLHCAARSRDYELRYVRHLLDAIFPMLIPKHANNCQGTKNFFRELLAGSVVMPAMDVLANPDVVNLLLQLLFDEEPMAVSTDPPTEPVLILQTFCTATSKSVQSPLRTGLSELLSNKDNTLYEFVKFMKTEGALHILNFCLGIEEFNRRIMNLDLTKQQIEVLHKEAKDTYHMFIAPDASDRISFGEDIEQELKKIVEGPSDYVKKLRPANTALFRAYGQAYVVLESVFLPLFYQSDAHYTRICGERLQKSLQRSSSKANIRRSNEPLINKIGSKIKGVFRSNNSDSNQEMLMEPEGSQLSLNHGMEPVDMPSDDDELCVPENVASPNRDLTAWRIEIPGLVIRPDGNKDVFMYIIKVQRIDIQAEQGAETAWEVERRYQEFYVLDSKLKEFHGGEFDDIPLPTKRPFGNKSREFIDSKRILFEKYLQSLLTKPVLRGSGLLHSFLTPGTEFVTKFLSDVNISRMVKSVPQRLMKEKGQHLEAFLQSFLNSVEAPKPKPRRQKPFENLEAFKALRGLFCQYIGKTDVTEINASANMQSKLGGTMFVNNADMLADKDSLHPDPTLEADILHLDGIFDYVLYLARSVFEVPSTVHHCLVTLRKIFKNILEAFVDSYLAMKLDQVKSEEQMEKIIHLLRDALFFDDDPPLTEEQQMKRRHETFKQMVDFFPGVLPWFLGRDKFHEGFKTVFDVLQYPKLNKQLSYVLLDTVILELFPELNEEVQYNA